jgi:hypothetical protein
MGKHQRSLFLLSDVDGQNRKLVDTYCGLLRTENCIVQVLRPRNLLTPFQHEKSFYLWEMFILGYIVL